MSDAAVIVDASVVLKWFVEGSEESVTEARSLLEQHIAGETRLAAPALMANELFNALCRRSPTDAAVAEALEAFFDLEVELVCPEREHFTVAALLVAKGAARPADATYAALALTRDCELVTADRRLARSLGSRVRVRVL